MKFKRSRYPDIPGREKYASPCWNLTARWIWADADWNTRFPFGTSLCVRAGRRPEPRSEQGCTIGFTLDVNAPLGEPNRLYVSGPRRNYMIGLLSWHTHVVTHVTTEMQRGKERRISHMKTVRCWPRLVRGQAWNRKRSEWARDHWSAVVVSPHDWADRWASAHPEKAAEAKRKHAEYKARAVRARKAADEQET